MGANAFGICGEDDGAIFEPGPSGSFLHEKSTKIGADPALGRSPVLH
jgi:hypothetical protein